jgi:membrane peptidoglycan carboxypeptidase
LEAFNQGAVVGVKAQTHNVHRLVGKGDRDFSASQVRHATSAGRCQRTVLATYFVVVGQGPEFDPIGFGTFGQDFGGEGAV